MPVAVTEPPVAIEIPRKLWTRAEVASLAESHPVEFEHLELVEGELINTMGKKRPHVTALALIVEWLRTTFGPRFVLTESTIDVAPEDNPTSEPEPDLIVLDRDLVDFNKENPRPENIRLLIEISDTTLGLDLRKKSALYARAGIVEYWSLDIAGRRMFVHRDPADGHYQSVLAYRAQELVSPLAAPDSYFRVADAFPE